MAPPPKQAGSAAVRTVAASQELNKLVAPIALYPDSLVAQILAASGLSTQIVEADRMARENPGLKGRDLAEAVDGRRRLGSEREVSGGVSHSAGELGRGFVVDF